MPKTVQELVTEALDVAGKVATGQAPDAEDFAAMRRKVEPVIAMLQQRRVVNATFLLGQPDTVSLVPDEWFIPLARCLAFYGTNDAIGDELQVLAALKEGGEEAFYQMRGQDDSDVPVRALYF